MCITTEFLGLQLWAQYPNHDALTKSLTAILDSMDALVEQKGTSITEQDIVKFYNQQDSLHHSGIMVIEKTTEFNIEDFDRFTHLSTMELKVINTLSKVKNGLLSFQNVRCIVGNITTGNNDWRHVTTDATIYKVLGYMLICELQKQIKNMETKSNQIYKAKAEFASAFALSCINSDSLLIDKTNWKEVTMFLCGLAI